MGVPECPRDGEEACQFQIVFCFQTREPRPPQSSPASGVSFDRSFLTPFLCSFPFSCFLLPIIKTRNLDIPLVNNARAPHSTACSGRHPSSTEGDCCLCLQFPIWKTSHTVKWEGVWRELGCLSRTASFAVRQESGHSLKSSLSVRVFLVRGNIWVVGRGQVARWEVAFANTGQMDKSQIGWQKRCILVTEFMDATCFYFF